MYVGMRFFHFVQQNDAEWTSSHGLGQHPAFAIADVARGVPLRVETV